MTYVDRDVICQKGKFRLEEWEDVNYCEHCFYNGDEPLGDEEVVILLSDLTKENEKLKQENIHLEDDLRYYKTKSASCEQGLIQYERELNTYKRKVEELLRKWYANANKLRTPIRKVDYGEDIGYWNGVKQFIEELSDKLGVDLE